MKNKLISIFIIFLLFSNIIFTHFNLPNFFQTWDVIFECFLIVLFVINFIKSLKIPKKYFACYLLLFLIIIVGLIGNILFNYASSYIAIFKDIFSFLKFPLAFLLIKNLGYDKKMSNVLDSKFLNFMKLIIVVISLFGILSLFVDIGMSVNEVRHGIRPYKFLFSHPTFLVMSMLLLLVIFEYKSDCIKHNNLFELLIVLIIILTMRTKGIAIIAFFLVFKCFGGFIKKYKIFSLIVAFLVVFVVGYDKLSLYASFSNSAREILYKGCFYLLKICFPFGSGFGTYASHISGQYMSKVYDFIDIKYVWEIAGNSIAQLGDTGFPYYIGQFGFVGCILLGILCKHMYDLATQNVHNKYPVLLLLMYAIIGLTTETTLLNFGIELGTILAIVSFEDSKKKTS